MSRTAQDWAAAQTALDPSKRWTLWHLADYAHHDGRHAFPSVATLCQLTGLKTRAMRYQLAELETGGYIKRGDQTMVSHYPADRRPVVWDLCLKARPVSTDPALIERGATECTPSIPGNRTRGATQRPNGVQRLAPNPRTNPLQLTEVPALGEGSARARATRPVDNSGCPPECFDPLVGSGPGWLDDDPETRAPVPCPSCRGQATRPTVRVAR